MHNLLDEENLFKFKSVGTEDALTAMHSCSLDSLRVLGTVKLNISFELSKLHPVKKLVRPSSFAEILRVTLSAGFKQPSIW